VICCIDLIMCTFQRLFIFTRSSLSCFFPIDFVHVQHTADSTPLSGAPNAPVQFSPQHMHMSPVRPGGGLAHEKFFTHAEGSVFKPPASRRKDKGVRRLPPPKQQVDTTNAAKVNTAKGSPTKTPGNTRRNVSSAGKAATLQWSKDYEKMVEEIRNLDINALQVVELASPSAKMSRETTDRTSLSIPLNTIQKSVPNEVEENLPTGWKVLVSRSTGQLYYGNMYTGDSCWKRPTEPAIAANSIDVHSKSANDTIIDVLPRTQSQPESDMEEAFDLDLVGQWESVPEIEPAHLSILPTNLPASLPASDSAVGSISIRTGDGMGMSQEQQQEQDLDMPLTLDKHVDLETNNRPHINTRANISTQGEQIIPSQLGRMGSTIHLAVTSAWLMATCVLLALESDWIKAGKFSDEERCTKGPQLMAWAIGMAAGLVVFASLLHFAVMRVRFGRPGVRISLFVVGLVDIGVFILGNVWAFNTFPSSGIGCDRTWKLAHIGYATSVCLIIFVYVGYSLAALVSAKGGGFTQKIAADEDLSRTSTELVSQPPPGPSATKLVSVVVATGRSPPHSYQPTNARTTSGTTSINILTPIPISIQTYIVMPVSHRCSRQMHTIAICQVLTKCLDASARLSVCHPLSAFPAHSAGETVDGHLVFDDKTPTPRMVSCQPPEVVTEPLRMSKTPIKARRR
jgi:hypothetical protein